MFKINLVIPDITYHGLKALDHCRLFGLPDSTYFATSGNRSERSSRNVPVSEGFARHHFGYEDTELEAEVPIEMLHMGDLVPLNATYVGWNPAITDERVRELFESAPVAEVSELS
jgi:hypothetical protein